MKTERPGALAPLMRQAMKEAGLKAADIATRLGVTRTTVYRWLGGQRIPDEDVIRKFAEAVGIPPGPLLGARDLSIEMTQGAHYVAMFLDWVLSGEPADDAIERSVEEGLVISPETRTELIALTDQLRASYNERSGGRWFRMHREDRLRLVQVAIELARTHPEGGWLQLSLKHPLRPKSNE